MTTKHAPGRDFYHSDTRIKSAGGTLADSRRGSKAAHDQGYRWIDCNGHLTKDIHWVNAHGAPFNPSWLKRGDKTERYTWVTLHAKHPLLRDARTTFAQNAALGLRTEWEVKDLHPIVSDAVLATAFERLAQDAQAAYGDDWQRHVEVKVLTNLAGGLTYAKKVLRHAHAAGFTTIVLPRGKHRLARINEPYITYNRGGRI